MERSLKIHTLRSSSKGNSTVVCGDDTVILVDCGISGKTLEESLGKLCINGREISAMVVTHEHTDHIKGVGVLSRKYNIPVYANEKTWRGMMGSVGGISPENRRVFRTGTEFTIGKIEVMPFYIPHNLRLEKLR